jgi:hypothetical protein
MLASKTEHFRCNLGIHNSVHFLFLHSFVHIHMHIICHGDIETILKCRMYKGNDMFLKSFVKLCNHSVLHIKHRPVNSCN